MKTTTITKEEAQVIIDLAKPGEEIPLAAFLVRRPKTITPEELARAKELEPVAREILARPEKSSDSSGLPSQDAVE